MTFFFDAYKDHIKEKGLSKNTISSYVTDIKKFIDYCFGRQITSPTLVDFAFLSNFLENMSHEGASNTSVNRMLAALRSYFRFLNQNGHIKNDPAKNQKLLDVRPKKMEYLNDREVASLCDFGRFYTPLEYRDTLMIYLCTHMGLNVSEVCALKVDDVNLPVGTLRIQGDKPRKTVIDDIAQKRLGHYISTLRPVILDHAEQVTALFPSIDKKAISRQGFWKNLNARCKLLKIKKHITPGSLKYSYMVKMIEDGIELQTILDNMGYNDRSTLRRCLKMLKEKYAKKSRNKIK